MPDMTIFIKKVGDKTSPLAHVYEVSIGPRKQRYELFAVTRYTSKQSFDAVAKRYLRFSDGALARLHQHEQARLVMSRNLSNDAAAALGWRG